MVGTETFRRRGSRLFIRSGSPGPLPENPGRKIGEHQTPWCPQAGPSLPSQRSHHHLKVTMTPFSGWPSSLWPVVVRVTSYAHYSPEKIYNHDTMADYTVSSAISPIFTELRPVKHENRQAHGVNYLDRYWQTLGLPETPDLIWKWGCGGRNHSS
jgi:hypothetical protein